jgi:hypothetical protein
VNALHITKHAPSGVCIASSGTHHLFTLPPLLLLLLLLLAICRHAVVGPPAAGCH